MSLVPRWNSSPSLPPPTYDRPFGSTTARDLVRDHVLRLTYTAHDLAPFARDLGYDGPPFRWDEEKRRHLRARLDALYFHLYGLHPRRRCLRPEHLPHRPPRRRGPVRHLPHPRPHPRLHARPRRRRHRVGQSRCRAGLTPGPSPSHSGWTRGESKLAPALTWMHRIDRI